VSHKWNTYNCTVAFTLGKMPLACAGYFLAPKPMKRRYTTRFSAEDGPRRSRVSQQKGPRLAGTAQSSGREEGARGAP
jgi:hypothetical protein